MKKILLIVSVCLFALSAARAGADTEIETAMKSMNRAFKQLRGQIADPAQNASSLELLAKVKAGAVESRKHTPEKTDTLPEKDRAAFVDAYQKSMDQFIETLDKLETALKAGKNTEAVALVAKLGEERKTGHGKFQQEH